MALFVDLILEEHLVQAQTKGNGAHHDAVSFMASLFVIVGHELGALDVRPTL
jgi:hypothetical protein